jgi:hypothetical protein
MRIMLPATFLLTAAGRSLWVDAFFAAPLERAAVTGIPPASSARWLV